MSEQTGRMPRLTGVFAGRLLILLVCHVAAHIILFQRLNWQPSAAAPETNALALTIQLVGLCVHLLAQEVLQTLAFDNQVQKQPGLIVSITN